MIQKHVIRSSLFYVIVTIIIPGGDQGWRWRGGKGVCEVCNLYISKIYIQYSSIRELKQYNKSLP